MKIKHANHYTSCHFSIKQGHRHLKIGRVTLIFGWGIQLWHSCQIDQIVINYSYNDDMFSFWYQRLENCETWHEDKFRNLPSMFRKQYTKCVANIDCSEIFIQTPTSLDVAGLIINNNQLWGIQLV